MIALVVALGAFGVALAAGRPLWLRALTGAAAVVIGAAATLLIQNVAKALLPDSTGWVEEEAGLWVSAVLTAVLILFWLGRRQGLHSRAPA